MKKLKVTGVAIIISFIILVGCDERQRATVNENVYKTIDSLNMHHIYNSTIVFYFDGDCAMCIAKAKYISEKGLIKNNSNLLLIARSENFGEFKFNLRAAHMKSKIILEKHHHFEKIFKFNEAIKVNSDKTFEPNYLATLLK